MGACRTTAMGKMPSNEETPVAEAKYQSLGWLIFHLFQLGGAAALLIAMKVGKSAEPHVQMFACSPTVMSCARRRHRQSIINKLVVDPSAVRQCHNNFNVRCHARADKGHVEPGEGGPPVLVLGGGLIGVSVAYYLALRGVRTMVVDHAGIASCASGKAGGFLARNWNDKGPLRALSRKSFDMHQDLAKTLGLQSYRRLSCKRVAISGTLLRKPDVRKLEGLEWVDAGAEREHSMGDQQTIAQVHPQELTEAMWMAAQDKAGSYFLRGTVNEVLVDEGCAVGALVDGHEIRAEVTVLCMGPWAQVLNLLVPNLRIYGQKCHSVLLRSKQVFSEAVFFSGLGNPEMYPRNNGDNYVTGFPDPVAIVTEPPGNVQVRREVCDRLVKSMRHVSSKMQTAEVSATQSCYLPLTADTYPAMGRVPSIPGAFVCAGHGCWGILNGPASGLGMAELILDGKATSVDIAPFDPLRLLSAPDPEWAPSTAL